MTALAATLGLMSNQQLVAAGTDLGRAQSDAVGAALLRRAIEGQDEAAWRVLVAEHYPAVLRQAVRACGSRDTAEDIAQETFLKVFRSGRSFRGDRPLAHWIARITTTTAIDVLRRSKAEPAELHETQAATADDPAGAVIRSENQRRVREAVLRLPAHLREVVWLTTFAELSYEAAAQELGIPMRTVMSRAVAARAQLRRSLTSLGDAQ
jgi:RNA polymerase sigma-70 factor (ECF subfamily)